MGVRGIKQHCCYTEWLYPKVQPLTLLHGIFDQFQVPFSYTLN